MIFNRSDEVFKRAANDEVERAALIKKLQKRRDFAFWGGFLGFIVMLLSLPLVILVSHSFSKSVGFIGEMPRFLSVMFFAMFGSSLFMNQDIKMLILSAKRPQEPRDETVEQGNGSPKGVGQESLTVGDGESM